MRKKIQNTVKHPLIIGTILLSSGTFLSSFMNFLFNLFLTRNLTLSDYGTFASLISLVTLVTLPAGSITPTIVRFGAEYFAAGNLQMARGLFYKITKTSFLIAVIVFSVFLLLRGEIAEFFRIDNEFVIVFVGVILFVGFAGIANTPLLQAKLSFRFISFANFFGAFIKLLLGSLLVFLGFGVNGAVLALFISIIIPYILSFLPLKFIFARKIKTPKIDGGELFKYAFPSSIAIFGLASFISTDLILVKHFFNAEDAGVYSGGLSLIGRVIFFITAPISTVMFPLVVQRYTRGDNYHKLFWLANFLVLTPSVCITAFYFLFPEFTIRFFVKKDEFLAVSSTLGFFGVFTSIYSLLYLITNFYLSIKKTKVFIPLLTGAVLQGIGIWLFHESFLHITIISLIIVSLLLFILLLYYFRMYGEEKK